MSQNDQRDHDTTRFKEQPSRERPAEDTDQGEESPQGAVMVRVNSRFVCLSRAQFIALCAKQ